MKKIYCFLAALLSAFVTNAQNPVWSTDVAPILYNNCTRCHNPNGIAPFSLITYSDAANNASNIAQEVSNRTMPPWPPDSSYTRFCNERILSQYEVQTILDWVNNGMPSGNLSQAPPAPTYSGSAQLANADLVSQMPTYTVNTATDLYRCFVMNSGVSTTQYITKVEVIPGNRNIVHHVLVYQDQANTCVNLDNNDPGPGYTWFGDVGSSTATLITGWVPGQGVYELPSNMGIKLLPNTHIIMQVHYPGGISNQVDSTQVRFTFSSGLVREVFLDPVINHWTSLTNGPLFIPADSVRTFHAYESAGLNASLISIAPHMHLIGQNIYNYAIDPANDTIPLIRINNWNFHWQGFYTFRQPVHIPYGSQLHAYATYDNTTNNPNNPNSPPDDVSVGEATTDEMFVIYYAYLVYQLGDENIIIDSTLIAGQNEQADYGTIVKTPQLYDPYPSPASSNSSVNVPYFLPAAASITIELMDVNGKLISVPVNHLNQQAGFGSQTISTSGLAAGTYVIRMNSAGVVRTKTIVIE
jgi:hypothetical protein